jgi:hypothetical protein
MMVDTIELLHEDVGDALRDIAFRRAARGQSLAQLEEAVAAQLNRVGVDVTVMKVTRPDPASSPDNDYRVDWQSKAGGPYEHQHFALTEPEGDWYVERYDRNGTTAKTAWKCGEGHARDLVAATVRRGEIARITPPPGATQEQLSRFTSLGRVELI